MVAKSCGVNDTPSTNFLLVLQICNTALSHIYCIVTIIIITCIMRIIHDSCSTTVPGSCSLLHDALSGFLVRVQFCKH